VPKEIMKRNGLEFRGYSPDHQVCSAPTDKQCKASVGKPSKTGSRKHYQRFGTTPKKWKDANKGYTKTLRDDYGRRRIESPRSQDALNATGFKFQGYSDDEKGT
jgi:hypothetical protein